ncbi:MAG: YciI family protein [Methanosarcinales archaeon]|nr:YciI family protein [Methanosarcinales archaeon]
MKNDPGKIRDIIPEHIRYTKNSKPINYSGGPFSDRGGGLILFEAENMETATELVINDPFITREVIKTRWVKEWIREL